MQILDSYRLELGEGPGYDPRTDTAWWFDITERKLFTRQLSEGRTRRHDLPVAASAMAVIEDGRHLLVAEDGLYLRDPASGALALHLGLEADKPGNRSNDARVHPCGAFWIGTMSWTSEPGMGSLYHYFRGELRVLWSGVSIPNAACFSPDGRTSYFCDTPTGRVMRVATDPDTGLPRGEPEVFLDRFDGGPDGAVTDVDGNFWIAIWGSGRVEGFSPDGKPIGALEFPAANVSCPAFIGPDARDMLVTSARHGLDAAERSAAPMSGATFVAPAPRTGRFDPPVKIA